ncbi:helix-turn-helix domain-containing protein [Leptolyngbya ohadii]|uniref:helix-turn-helix domain-containing protein n=1 Tax=Leptolyngbya ohadii TaxID=1962290 RepID=UPI000B59A8DF|nr:helix-turn-helix domain-containing protein [Leptolyngbya ohadii]
MSESLALTEKQLDAIALLASGKSQVATARDIGVDRKTIARWMAIAEFNAELERRRSRLQEQHISQADALQDETISQFYQDLKAYREARLNIYRAKLSRAVDILKKAGRRFNDLPDEAIAPGSLVGLFSIADQLSESGLNGWAEILAIDELLKRLEGNGE